MPLCYADDCNEADGGGGFVLTHSGTMQYVILTYMKHLGVKVKEPRVLEPKPKRINFNLPKIKVGYCQCCEYGQRLCFAML